MNAIAIARSSLTTSLLRYSRSWGLWLLLLVAPVGARFMIAGDDGSGGVQISVGHHLPVMTSAVLGVSLGIVVSTLLLPIGFLYLRSNTTRRQPWQVEEVTAGSRVAIMLGRFGADVGVFFAMLAALTLAGVMLGFLIVSGPLNPASIALGLWIVAAPAVMGMVAIRLLFDALPITRRAIGELLFMFLWLFSIAAPAIVDGLPSSLGVNMHDFAGYMRPLVGGAPDGASDFAIGGDSGILAGRIPLDVMAGIKSQGYIASRFAWAAIAVMIAGFAGLVYRPHKPVNRRPIAARIGKVFAPGAPRPANPAAPRATVADWPFVGLIIAELRLIGHGPLFAILAMGAAGAGLLSDYRHIGSPAAALLLIFAAVAHAGRSEARGLLALTGISPLSPVARRIAFVLATLGLSTAMSLPATIGTLSPQPLILALATGGVIALLSITLAAISRSAFAPRLVLLVLWYGYLST